ncbi:MAG: 30S ribosomal protein S16 [Spirochaetes bacterium]|nr:30S ribosomal protein S16 [Spirochaetota bacterium]
MVKIRLQRFGAKKKPSYRVVAIDERKQRDGAIIENLGQYQPVSSGLQFSVDEDKMLTWLKNGAQPTETVLRMLKKQGIWKKHLESVK